MKFTLISIACKTFHHLSVHGKESESEVAAAAAAAKSRQSATCFDLCIFAGVRGATWQVKAREAEGKETCCPKRIPGDNHRKTAPG